MSSFLHRNCFISKLINFEIDLKDIYVPFVTDSDALLNIQKDLKKTTAVRRYECLNCVKKNLTPYVWTILPCCMPY